MTRAPDSIALRRLDDFWLHTGTACNLSCPFCHEGSKPGDTRLQALTLAETAPLLDAAAAAGARRFVFTGGEPLILREILPLLQHALQLLPTRVLTNGTAPFLRRSHQLALLRAAPQPLSFRVSIDAPDEAVHDAGRGLKNFRKALEGLRLLHAAGFAVGITRQLQPGEDAAQVAQKFRLLLRRQGLPEETPVDVLPVLDALEGGEPATAAQFPTHGTAASNDPPCANGRMLIRRDGTLRLTACAMVDDDASFDAPANLPLVVGGAVEARHRRCSACRAGARYGGIG